MKKSAAIFSIVIGSCMLIMWVFLLVSGNVKELETELTRILFHIFSEVITGGLLIVAGVLLLKGKHIANALYYLATGALIYSLLNALGYYLEFLNAGFIIMFSAILGGALIFLLSSFQRK